MWPRRIQKDSGSHQWEPTERITGASRLLFSAPEPKVLIGPLILVSLIGGLLLSFFPDVSVAEGLQYGVFLLAVPAFAALLTSTWTVSLLGGKFYLRRSVLLAFSCVVLIVLIIICALVFRALNEALFHPIIVLPWQFVFVYGYSLALVLRYLIFRVSCFGRHDYAFLGAIQQSFFALLLFFVWAFYEPDIMGEEDLGRLIRFAVLSSLVLFAAALFYVDLVNAPMKNDIGVDTTDLINYILRYLVEGTHELDVVFEPLKTEVDLPISILGVCDRVSDPDRDRAVSDPDAQQRPLKALIIAPAVHPGPMGTMGGADLPAKLDESLSDIAEHILVPHSTATNDFNPATAAECVKIADTIRELVGELTFGSCAGTSTDPSKCVRQDTALTTLERSSTLHSFTIGGGLVLCCVPYPEGFDDISVGVGEQLAGRAHGVMKSDAPVMVLDAHNHINRECKTTSTGYRKATEFFEMAAEMASGIVSGTGIGPDEQTARAAHEEDGKQGLRMGFSQIPGKQFGTDMGIASCGLQVTVLDGSPSGKRTALLLFDGNNMMADFRHAAHRAALEFVDEAEVLTTDNHFVNATIGGFNPVGLRLDVNDVLHLIRDAVKQAVDDLAPVEAEMRQGVIRDINVIGHGNTSRIVTHINATLAIGRKALLPCLLLAAVASMMVYWIV